MTNKSKVRISVLESQVVDILNTLTVLPSRIHITYSMTKGVLFDLIKSKYVNLLNLRTEVVLSNIMFKALSGNDVLDLVNVINESEFISEDDKNIIKARLISVMRKNPNLRLLQQIMCEPEVYRNIPKPFCTDLFTDHLVLPTDVRKSDSKIKARFKLALSNISFIRFNFGRIANHFHDKPISSYPFFMYVLTQVFMKKYSYVANKPIKLLIRHLSGKAPKEDILEKLDVDGFVEAKYLKMARKYLSLKLLICVIDELFEIDLEKYMVIVRIIDILPSDRNYTLLISTLAETSREAMFYELTRTKTNYNNLSDPALINIISSFIGNRSSYDYVANYVEKVLTPKVRSRSKKVA